MKKIIVYLLSVIAATSAWGQMDNVVEVENNFQPVLKDATKINSLPEIEQTQATHYNVNYTTTPVPATTYVFQPMWAAHNSQLIRRDKKGFATAAYGIDNNMLGRLAYGFDLTDDSQLSLDFSSRGHNSKIDHATGTRKWMSRFFTNQFRATYEHQFDDTSSLLIDGSYQTDLFNYQSPLSDLTHTDKQHNDVFEANIELTPYAFGDFALGATASASNFSQKYATNFAKGVSETRLSLGLQPEYRFSDEVKVDVEICFDYSDYNMNANLATVKGSTGFDFTPHFYWNNDVVDIKAGAFIGTSGNFSPDVDVTIHLNPAIDVYLQAHGGDVKNSFRRFSLMSPYWRLNDTDFEMSDQFDQLRGMAGVIFKPFEGLYANLAAGYEISEDRAEIADFLMDETVQPTYAPIFFADGKRFFATGNISYNYHNVFKADLNATYNVWSTSFKPMGPQTTNWDKILWRPRLDATCTLSAMPFKGLTVGADLLFQNFRNETNRYKRDNTMNLGASVSYTFPCRLTLYAKGDNLLNKTYDQYTMYRTSGTNFLAGAAITF